MKILFLTGLLFVVTAMQSLTPKEGAYRGVLLLNEKEGRELPFSFTFFLKNNRPIIQIKNAEETITVDEVWLSKDSLNFKMPVFDTEFRTKITATGLEGVWINHYRKTDNTLPFRATFGNAPRFAKPVTNSPQAINGRWECTFSPNSAGQYKAVGLFEHNRKTGYARGTFLTETGDYRYLEGVFNGRTLLLSCFDGSHAFLFEAELKNDSLQGMFYSGAHWREPWTGITNNSFHLRNPNEITQLTGTNTALHFTLTSLSGATVSLSDKRFENKPVILQLMGSWCPNCMDESAYLAELYERYKKQGLEIIGLAFEKTDNYETAQRQLLRLKNRLNIGYEILPTLKTGKASALSMFPMLNEVSAFPTTLFLNKQHKVVKIHTGFNGPATGSNYTLFTRETEALVENLLKE